MDSTAKIALTDKNTKFAIDPFDIVPKIIQAMDELGCFFVNLFCL
jgi:hypothetical protein